MILVALDLETTGLHPIKDKIVEIGAVKFREDKIIENLEILVNPGKKIPGYVSRIHGITNDMVRDCPTISEVLPELLAFLSDHSLVLHNAPFDLGFVHFELSRQRKGVLENPKLDTCHIARELLPEAPGYGLQTLVSFLNLPSGTFHRALADARHTQQLLLACATAISPSLSESFDKLHDISRKAYTFLEPEILRDATFAGRDSFMDAIESGTSVRIVYRDMNGRTTHRTITPFLLGKQKGTIQVSAFCHFRKETREFRVDRIVSAG